MRAICLPLLLTTLLLGACRNGGEHASGRPGPPNFVILFCDDLGYGDLSSYGHPLIRTPNLDRLAADGMKFTDFYAASPACSASRYSLLTGRYPVFSGFDWVLYPDSPRGLHPKETTVAERLQAAGYACAAFGKWHLGSTDRRYLPLQQGFDEYLGLPYSNDMLPPKWPDLALLAGNDTLDMNPDQAPLTRVYTERALEFMERHRDQPFFLYLPYAMPHVPLHPGPEFAGRSERGPYGDAVEELDWSAGALRQKLEELGLADNTLLFFTSDNGPWIIKGEDGGSAGPLRDGKGSTWEGGMRVPAIAWWPGSVPEGSITAAPASTLDLYPTLLALAGLEAPAAAPLDGRDLSGLLLGGAPPPTTPFIYHGPGNRPQAVREGRWKLHLHTNSQTGQDYFDGQSPLLFDLETDPGETTNVAIDHPRVVARLTTALLDHQSRLDRFVDFFEAERQSRRTEHLGQGRAVLMRPAPSDRYGPDSLLADGLPGDPADLHTFTGIRGRPLQCTIDLGEGFMAEKVRVGFLHQPAQWIFAPRSVEILISPDGKSYKSRGKLNTQESWRELPTGVKTYEILMRDQPVRYVKVVARPLPGGPAGHPSAGEPVWMLADEVWVE